MLNLISDLEKEGDPMEVPLLAYNYHEFNHEFYPQGGAGWLFSNAAMQRFVENIDTFIGACKGGFDDVALGWFIKSINIDLEHFQTNRIIVTFPISQVDQILDDDYSQIKECPEYYYLVPGKNGLRPCPVKKAASIHMHQIPMTTVKKLLDKVPNDFAVYFPDPNTPLFCKMNNRAQY
ncbi:hypothetical protein GPJ56_005416 [Histomonas meleagridis]|uniref:uncharacterized protein n=1 Tax=Histomonas meleagridis TaxID=135588 RepID=UPI003559AA95|nr:hypothetical protein GPJ56_005416 [Histomonas meleagridis]KAH0801813.1 hypothetical protein GO595_005380 [Histomonas meleagridis]